jgi:hypothetical protein
MRSALLREFIVASKGPALTVGLVAHLSVLSCFFIVWNRGLPALGATLYDQQLTVQWWLLSALLPWLAVRALGAEQGDALTLAAARIAVRPSALVMSKVLAVGATLALIVCAGVPVTALAQQVSALSFSHIVVDAASLCGLALLAAVVATVWVSVVPDRLLAWMATTASVVFVVVLASMPSTVGLRGVLLWVASAVLGVTAARWSDSAFRYLAVRRA